MAIKEIYTKGNTIVFYPEFCLDCMLDYVSKTKSNPCPYCGSENTINYERKLHKNIKKTINL
jgi:predicted Zn-ribbon and HTH transcriptional regulator